MSVGVVVAAWSGRASGVELFGTRISQFLSGRIDTCASSPPAAQPEPNHLSHPSRVRRAQGNRSHRYRLLCASNTNPQPRSPATRIQKPQRAHHPGKRPRGPARPCPTALPTTARTAALILPPPQPPEATQHRNPASPHSPPGPTTIMEGAFTHLGNHLVSDSASTINAGDDESILDGDLGRSNLNGRRRRLDDDEDGDTYDEDDMESMASMQIGGKQQKPDEDVELPPHACA